MAHLLEILVQPFPVTRIAHIPDTEDAPRWLVDGLWGAQAVGFIGGTPKSAKTWLALELAIAVASGSPCLGHYDVSERGPVLLYAAEDTAAAIKERVSAITNARDMGNIDRLALGLITTPTLRLDNPEHRDRLESTITKTKPKMLVLDPLVRLHQADENSAAEISRLLGFLRHLQRKHGVAIVVVHHLRKSGSSQPGQALRGSGDIHAWSDSSLYLLRRKGRLELRAEHRAHPCPPPVVVELRSNPAPHLALVTTADQADPETLATQILEAIRNQPMTRAALRELLRVRNARLGELIRRLESKGLLECRDGRLVPTP